MVSIKRNCNKGVILAYSAHKYSSRVSNICTENFGSNNENWDTCWAWESQINFWVSVKCFLNLYETSVELFFYFCGIYNSLSYLSLIKSILYTFLYIETQLSFHKLRYLLSKDSVTIAYWKEMSSSILSQMWQDEIRILVYLVGVFRAETSLCRKREFRDTIIKLFLSLRTLSWLW